MTDSLDKSPPSDQTTNKRRGGTPLKRLDLSRRTYNALFRGGIRTIDELMQWPRKRLAHIRNIGPTALAEIKTQLALYHADQGSATPDIQEKLQSPKSSKPYVAIRTYYRTPATKTSNNKPPQLFDDWSATFETLSGNNTPISILNLTEGLTQRLKKAQFKSISDLAQASIEDLLAVPQIGHKSINRVRTALMGFMREPDIPFDALLEEDTIPKHEVTVEAITPRRHTLGALISPDQADQLADAPLDLVPIERLALNTTQINKLYQTTMHTVGQLVDFSTYLSPADPAIAALVAYLTAAEPEQLTQDALSAEALQRHWSRKAADVSLWLLSLKERERSILEKRYGLHGPALTLEEIGNEFNVTRERVRQLVNRSLRGLEGKHAANINTVAEALTSYIQECGGVITLAEAADWYREQYLSNDGVDATGAIGLLSALTDKLHYMRKPKVFLSNALPAELLTKIQKTFTDLLQARMSPTAVDALLDDFRSDPKHYRSVRSLWPADAGIDLDVFLRACLRTSDDIIEEEPGVYARRQWANRITDNIVVALRQIGEPAHFAAIAEEVNRQLSPDRQTTPHNVHATMLRYEHIFTRVGHGTYALVEWDIKREQTVAETAARILREAGQPLHIETITDEALKSWHVNRSTIYAALHFEDYYRENSAHADLCLLLGGGVFTLSEREARRANEGQPVLPFCPPILPDPPNFENALFESVIVARNILAERPRANAFVAKMFAWAEHDGEPRRWLQQGVLNSYYLLGVIPYTFIFGGANPRLRSALPNSSINELRKSCLATLSRRLSHMPAFWGLLRHRAPARQGELAAEYVPARGDGLDDTEARLALLAGLGAVVRGEDYHFRLTSLGMEAARAWGVWPLSGSGAEPAPVEDSGREEWDDLLGLGVWE